MANFEYDCIIIGGGPGGLVSALYLGRFRRKVLLIDAGQSRARWIPRIRNLIGYAKGLTGPQLLKRLRKQVAQYPVDFINGSAAIRREKKAFIVEVGKQVFKAKKIILATGMIDAQPAIENIPYFRSLGILGYCPICDGYDHIEHKVALFIKNNHCFRKIRFISALCPKLVIIPTGKISYSTKLKSFANENKLKLLSTPLDRLEYNKRSKKLLVYVKYLKKPFVMDFAYVSLGVEFDKTAVSRLKNLRTTKDGYIVTSSHQETSIPGLYAVGDCVNALAQVSVAIGQAALASTRIHHDLFYSHK